MSVTDPVCGTELTSSSAVAIEGYGALALHFCSEACHQRFIDNPAHFVSHDTGNIEHVHTNEDVAVMPQPWRDEGDLDGPPTKR